MMRGARFPSSADSLTSFSRGSSCRPEKALKKNLSFPSLPLLSGFSEQKFLSRHFCDRRRACRRRRRLLRRRRRRRFLRRGHACLAIWFGGEQCGSPTREYLVFQALLHLLQSSVFVAFADISLLSPRRRRTVSAASRRPKRPDAMRKRARFTAKGRATTDRHFARNCRATETSGSSNVLFGVARRKLISREFPPLIVMGRQVGSRLSAG